MKITLMNGNVLDMLKKIPDESVDCVVTSPPYYGLRSYKGADTIWGGNPECEHEWVSQKVYQDNLRFRDPNHVAQVGNNKNPEIFDNPSTKADLCSKCGAWKGQLGLEPTYNLYVEHLMLVMDEIKRVLKKTGTVFWNMGDSYSSKGGMSNPEHLINAKVGNTKSGEQKGIRYINSLINDIPDKSLMMIPERFAMSAIDNGWILRNKIIWYKRNGMPSSVKDRFSNKWEYVYFFTKSRKYYFDLDSVRKPFSQESIKRRQQKKVSINMQKFEGEGAYKRKHSGYKNTDGSNRINENGANPGDVIKVAAVRYKSWYSYLSPNYPHTRIYDPDADGGDFHDVPTTPHAFAHFAVYPETLIESLIKSGCPKDGVVLDPFAGSGTTGLVARNLGRSSILIEISSEYCNIIKDRLNWGAGIDIEYEVNS